MSQSPNPRPIDNPDLQIVRPEDRLPRSNDPRPAPIRVANTEQVSESSAGVVQHERVVTDQSGLAHSERTVHDVAGDQRLGLYRATQLIWLVFGIIEGLIGLRVILKLIGANPNNAFANFIYDAAGIFLAPFFSLTASPAAGATVLEIPSILAMLVYALLGWVVVKIARILWPMFSRSSTSSTSTYDRY